MPAPALAPSLPAIPDDVPDEVTFQQDGIAAVRAGDVLLPAVTAQAVAVYMARAEAYPEQAQAVMDAKHEADRAFLDEVMETNRTDKAAAVAEAIAEVDPVPWWVWGLGGFAVGVVAAGIVALPLVSGGVP